MIKFKPGERVIVVAVTEGRYWTGEFIDEIEDKNQNLKYQIRKAWTGISRVRRDEDGATFTDENGDLIRDQIPAVVVNVNPVNCFHSRGSHDKNMEFIKRLQVEQAEVMACRKALESGITETKKGDIVVNSLAGLKLAAAKKKAKKTLIAVESQG